MSEKASDTVQLGLVRVEEDLQLQKDILPASEELSSNLVGNLDTKNGKYRCWRGAS